MSLATARAIEGDPGACGCEVVDELSREVLLDSGDTGHRRNALYPNIDMGRGVAGTLIEGFRPESIKQKPSESRCVQSGGRIQ